MDDQEKKPSPFIRLPDEGLADVLEKLDLLCTADRRTRGAQVAAIIDEAYARKLGQLVLSKES